LNATRNEFLITTVVLDEYITFSSQTSKEAPAISGSAFALDYKQSDIVCLAGTGAKIQNGLNNG